MRSKDCRHYSRRELIEIIYELEKREDRLRRKLKKAQAQLLDRSVRIENAGSLAEAEAIVSNLFAAADETAQLYLGTLRARAGEGTLRLEEREGA